MRIIFLVIILFCLNGCNKSSSELKKICFIPYVDFVAYNVNPNTLEVSFNNIVTSNGTIKTQVWDFGDGSTFSGATIPTHTYAKLTSTEPVKTYHVKYTVSNDCGSSFWTKDIAVGPCLANTKFAYTTLNDSTIQFTNQTTSATPASYLWQFGDQATSTATTTTFTKSYKTSGTYVVSLRATNACGDNFYTQSIVIKKNPTVTTNAATSLKATGVVLGGNVINNGGLSLTERGVCWGQSHLPTITGNGAFLKSSVTATGTYSINVTKLSANTVYYARAYAINTSGNSTPGYGDEISFTTTALPTISTNNVTSLTSESALTGGNISNANGTTVIKRGVCYDINAGAILKSTNTTSDGSGTGSYATNITGLSGNTTYFVKAYAITNNNDTALGSELSFTTRADPVVITTAMGSITPLSATAGGNVVSDGGLTIVEKGICWGFVQNPTISDNHASFGTGIGSFTGTITGLSGGTDYFVRAYARNSNNHYFYGDNVSFKTPVSPTVTTNSISTVSISSYNVTGVVTSDGGAAVTERGICWSTSPSPTKKSNVVIASGQGIGSFNGVITGLSPNTIYYIKPYATNIAGTGYGSQLTITTTGYAIGATGPAGGIVFFDKGSFSNGWRYLEMSPSDQSTGTTWGCSGTSISGATAATTGNGANNTIAIVNGCATAGIAARICDQLSINGFSDWFLPSIDELNLMYQNSPIFNAFTNAYWSSTQSSSTLSYYLNFSSGIITTTSKNTSLRVRAIRMF